MAQLNDTIIVGNLSTTGTIYGNLSGTATCATCATKATQLNNNGLSNLGTCVLSWSGASGQAGLSEWTNILTIAHGCGNNYYNTQLAQNFTGVRDYIKFRALKNNSQGVWHTVIDDQGGQEIGGTLKATCFIGNVCGCVTNIYDCSDNGACILTVDKSYGFCHYRCCSSSCQMWTSLDWTGLNIYNNSKSAGIDIYSIVTDGVSIDKYAIDATCYYVGENCLSLGNIVMEPDLLRFSNYCVILNNSTQGNDWIFRGSACCACCTCCTYIESYSANADRPVIVTCGTNTYESIGRSTCCTFTFNPSTGYVTARRFKGDLVGNWAEPAQPSSGAADFCLYAWKNTTTEIQVAVACCNGLLYQRVWGTNSNYDYKIPIFNITGTQSVSTCSSLSWFGINTENTFTYNPSTNVFKVGTICASTVCSSDGKLGTGTVTQVKVGTTAYNPSSGVISLPDCANDSAKLNGYGSSTSATANSIAMRDANGYLYATYYNQSSGAETPTTSSYIIYANSDGWFRKSSLANIKTILGLGSVAYCSYTDVMNGSKDYTCWCKLSNWVSYMDKAPLRYWCICGASNCIWYCGFHSQMKTFYTCLGYSLRCIFDSGPIFTIFGKNIKNFKDAVYLTIGARDYSADDDIWYLFTKYNGTSTNCYITANTTSALTSTPYCFGMMWL